MTEIHIKNLYDYLRGLFPGYAWLHNITSVGEWKRIFGFINFSEIEGILLNFFTVNKGITLRQPNYLFNSMFFSSQKANTSSAMGSKLKQSSASLASGLSTGLEFVYRRIMQNVRSVVTGQPIYNKKAEDTVRDWVKRQHSYSVIDM